MQGLAELDVALGSGVLLDRAAGLLELLAAELLRLATELPRLLRVELLQRLRVGQVVEAEPGILEALVAATDRFALQSHMSAHH